MYILHICIYTSTHAGISVPESYTSFLAPISSPKLHQEVKAYNDVKHFETTYVVKMHQHKVLSEAKECWTIYICISMSIFIYVCLYLSIYLSIYLIYLSIYLSTDLSIYLSI